MLRTLAVLAVIGIVAAGLLAGVHSLTVDRIAVENERRSLAMLDQLLPEGSYDNELIRDRFTTSVPDLEPDSTIYRARSGETPVAVLADVVTARGYSGDIRLLVAVDPNGTVLGVRVLEHRETPGLGDLIEAERSDWIEQFDGTALGSPPIDEWRTSKRGGEFDTLSSATITSSAVVDAVRQVLAWFEDHRHDVFERASESPAAAPPGSR